MSNAVLVLKKLCKSFESAGENLSIIDGLDLTMRAIRLPKDPACTTCGSAG